MLLVCKFAYSFSADAVKRDGCVCFVGNRACTAGDQAETKLLLLETDACAAGANEVSFCFLNEPAEQDERTIKQPNQFHFFVSGMREKVKAIFWICQRRTCGQSLSTGHVHLLGILQSR